MSSICGVQKKQNSYSCQKAIKPFIFKEYPSLNPSQNQSLFSISHIYLHAMAFSSLRVSWGSEVEIKNTKTGLSAKACVLSNENIEQNCILMDSHLKEHLKVDDGNRILVKSFPSIYEQKILSQQQDRLKDRQCDDCSQYAYQKNQCYQLIAKIIGKKLKIQLRIIRGWQGPKLYVLQVAKNIQNIPISSILGYLKKQENYRIYPENGTIEIISPEGQIINIELIQMNKPKNIDTQVIMNLIQDLYNKVNVSKNYATNENICSDDLVSNLAQQIKQNNDDIPAKPQSFQKSLLTAETQARNAQIQEISSNNVKKTSTQFKPSPDNPKYFQNPQIKSMQMKIESLQKKVLELSACLKIKAGENKAEAQAQQKIFQQKLIMPKIEQSQSSLSKYMQNFQIEESIGSNPKAVNLTVTLKSDSNWLQISPYFIKNKKLIKQKMRVISSSKKMIFFGLVSKNMSKQSSSWMNTGSVGCFLNNGKLFYNGNQIQRTDQKEQPLANQGDVLQIKLNKLFQQISWIVNGKEKIKVNIPELFEKYNPVKQWTIYSEMFNQGDKINFESQQF